MGRSQRTILHFIDSNGVYGAERVILNLSMEMVRDERFQPIVGCIVNDSTADGALQQAARAQGLPVLNVVIANRFLLRDLVRTAQWLRRSGVDLVHTHGYKPAVFAHFLSRFTGVPALATSHLWSTPEDYPLKMRLMVALSERLYKHYPHVVAVSEPIRQSLIGVGVAADRVDLIPNGVPVPESGGAADPPDAAVALRRELGLGPQEQVVLNAGRLTRQKAQIVIIEAAALLRDRGFGGRVLIVGEGELEKDLRRAIAARGLQETVVLLGFRRDIQKLLGIADLFILPSLFEGMPMSLLEAAAKSVPVVATPVGDVPELISHEESGLLVPCGDAEALAQAIATVLDDPAYGARLAGRAHARMVNTYSSAAMYRRYSELYTRLIAGGTMCSHRGAEANLIARRRGSM